MKRFKIGFLTVIALLAIGLTAATNPKSLNKLFPTSDDCANGITTFAYNPGPGAITIDQSDECIEAFDELANLCVNPLSQSPTEVTCGGEPLFFCCAEVDETDESCTSEPYTELITKVNCKETN